MLQLTGLSAGQNVSSYEDCAKKRNILLNALFETDGNLFELDRVFFPTRIPTSRYIRVKYTFLDSDDIDLDEGNCSVTYIWAVGGFLFIQPPKVFQFTSLLFSTPANDLESLNLTLPSECRPLVMNETNNCTCLKKNKNDNGKNDNALVRLTQQVCSEMRKLRTK